jgi:molybdate transport system regulatory protein
MAERESKSVGTAHLRGRLWVEFGSTVALTEAGADLLEQIDAVQSLSEAARRLGYSYRRAWTLVQAMNQHWPRGLVVTQTGGTKGGGAHLTEAGHAVLTAYRDLQLQLENLLGQQADVFHQTLAGVGIDLGRE